MTLKRAILIFLLIAFGVYSANCESRHKTKEEHYPNGKLKAVSTYNNEGLLDGESREYYENGKIESERNYKNGKLDGTSKSYYENGFLKSVGDYKAGTLDGKFDEFDEHGMLKKPTNDDDSNKQDTLTDLPEADNPRTSKRKTFRNPSGF